MINSSTLATRLDLGILQHMHQQPTPSCFTAMITLGMNNTNLVISPSFSTYYLFKNKKQKLFLIWVGTTVLKAQPRSMAKELLTNQQCRFPSGQRRC